MTTVWIQLLTAFFGSLGFALLFGLRRRYLLPASLGGMLAWGIYLAMEAWLGLPFLSGLTASAFAVLYAELLAHWLRSPATMFVVPAILPLVPGGSLYHAMSYAVHGDLAQARSSGIDTLLMALAIAAGLSLVLALRELRTRR